MEEHDHLVEVTSETTTHETQKKEAKATVRKKVGVMG